MRILLLEDADRIDGDMAQLLEGEGHDVVILKERDHDFAAATSPTFDLLLTDVVMSRWKGAQFIRAVETLCPDLPVIVVTAMEPARARDQLAGLKNVTALLKRSGDIVRLKEAVASVSLSRGSSHTVRKLARIVCTVGPACDNEEILGSMIRSGMDVARLNFSHGSYDLHRSSITAIRKAETRWSRTVAILQDLRGPKIRTGAMAGGGAELVAGRTVTIQADPIEGGPTRFSTITPSILADLRGGDPILLDDGLMHLLVEEEGADEVLCRVIVGGLLKSNKGMNLPGTALNLPGVTEKDRQDLAWGLENGVDFVALSFVRRADEVREVKDIIKRAGSKAGVVAKIEKPEGVENIDSIIEVSNAIMIARGDMGVELAPWRVPGIQREIIRKCRDSNTPVITATQMLDSMTSNYRPTRAEVSDVSTAIRDGSDAVMLSGETAVGVDPVNVVRTMSSIIAEEEKFNRLEPGDWQRMLDQTPLNPGITAGTTMANSTAIAIIDYDGLYYRHLSKWVRDRMLFLVTDSEAVARRSCLKHGVIALVVKERLSIEEVVPLALKEIGRWGYLATGDAVTVVEGAATLDGNVQQAGAIRIVSLP